VYITGRLPLLVGLGVVPVVLLSIGGVDAWLTMLGWLVLCALLAGADAAAAPDPRRVRIDRRLPRRALLGERADATLVLHNMGSRRVRGLLRDAWQPTAGAPSRRIAYGVDPGASQELSVPLLPRRRGELASAFVVLRSAGPIGLAGRQTRIASRGAIRVLPPFTARRHLPSRLARLKELDGNTSVQVRGQGTEFDSLRIYVRGDDVRSIDWRATARAGTTMLRTWRPERDRHVVILIDTGRTSAARVGDGARLDAEMEAALLLSALATRAGDHVHLVMFDRVVRARVSRVDGAALLPALVDAMAPVEPQLLDTDWDAAPAHIRALAGLAHRAHVLVGTATDTGLDILARERASAEDVYRAAAAERALQDAARIAGLVARAGGEAIADTPEALPPRIADRYLDLKATGRL